MNQDHIKYVMDKFNKNREEAIDMLNKGFNIEYLFNGLKKETIQQIKDISEETKQKIDDIIKEELD
jgi:hypothetical protein